MRLVHWMFTHIPHSHRWTFSAWRREGKHHVRYFEKCRLCDARRSDLA